ncbi:MAG: hypothetical protein IJX06_02275 [Clostridia bacterium]|nr:hypothetical protein [Clostridia bacterium]
MVVLRNRLCLRARFFASLKNDNAREKRPYRTVKGVSIGLQPVHPIPSLQAKLD